MKKTIAVILAVIFAFSCISVFAAADNQALPESDHDYENNEYREWVYTVPGATALLVAFSSDTWLDPGLIFNPIEIKTVEPGVLTVGDVYNNIINLRFGDNLYIYGNDGLIGTYTGSQLAGERIFVPGDTVKIVLESDSSVTGYGFKVDSIVPVSDSDLHTVTYHGCRDDLTEYTDSFYSPVGFTADTHFRTNRILSGVCFAGWSLTENGAVDYNPGALIDCDKDIDLYAVWAPVLLGEDEVFYFNNSAWYFEVTEDGTYYMTEEDYRAMQANLYRVYGIGPMPSIAMSIVLSKYPEWDFRGSCYGISTCVALQHYGIIDMLSSQDAVCVRDLDPDDDLISFINYYQSQAATSWITENKAYNPGDAVYRASMKALYDSVNEGNIVMMTYYTGNAFTTSGHTVLMTGCYDDAEGNHVLISYNCNYPSRYYDGSYTSLYTISPDWSEVSYEGDVLGAINWTDNFTQFESFSIDMNGNILSWYKAFFEHILDLFRSITSVFSMMFS